MRLVITEFMSIDGVIDSPQDWSFPYWNDEIAKFKDEERERADALLLGRLTYESFSAAWPGRTGAFADRMNGLPKFVVSKTLRSADWNNSRIVGGDLAAAVTELKAAPGRDLLVDGSATLAQALLAMGLVDELRLLVYPLFLGRGKRLFDPTSTGKLELATSQTFASGVVALVYRAAQ